VKWSQPAFVMDAKKRPDAPSKDRKSNYIMKLTQAILEHLYPYFIVLHQHVLYIRWKLIQAWSGGLLLMTPCDGYNPFELEDREFGWWLRFNGYLSAVTNVWTLLSIFYAVIFGPPRLFNGIGISHFPAGILIPPPPRMFP
jgi:hypothetical protein